MLEYWLRSCGQQQKHGSNLAAFFVTALHPAPADSTMRGVAVDRQVEKQQLGHKQGLT
jgi:hypothetical protein